MPIYEYQCKKCGEEFEELVFDDELLSCPCCNSLETERLVSRSCFHGIGVENLGNSCRGCSGGNCSSCH